MENERPCRRRRLSLSPAAGAFTVRRATAADDALCGPALPPRATEAAAALSDELEEEATGAEGRRGTAVVLHLKVYWEPLCDGM